MDNESRKPTVENVRCCVCKKPQLPTEMAEGMEDGSYICHKCVEAERPEFDQMS